MPTVTIGSTDYDVLQGLDDANEFLAADFSADAWRAESDIDKQKRALVTATRLLDRQQWPGTKTDEDQLHAWPRTGTNIDGVEVDEVPQGIEDASIVLAKLIHQGSKVESSPSTQTGNIRSQQAGSVRIEYFFPVDDPTRWPTEIQELLALYLGTGGVGAGVVVSGTDGCSMTNERFDTGWPG